jgi:hypothetical protein
MSQKLAGQETKHISLEELAEKIRSREDLTRFVHALQASLKDKPGDWENAELGPYLEGIGAWLVDMDGYYKSRGEAVPKQPTWKTLGQILLAARVYE